MELFEARALASQRARATHCFDRRLFIHAAQQLRDRLDPLRVSFSRVLDVTPSHTGGLFPFFSDLQDASCWTWSATPQALEGLAPASFDLVVSALEAHWVDDLPAFFERLRGLLKPQGLFLCTFWGGATLQELRHALFHAESARTGGAAARVSPMVSLEEGMKLLNSLGLSCPVGDQETLTVLYPHLKSLFGHLRNMGERNALTNRSLASRTLFREAERFYKMTYGTPEGDLPATFQLITLTGWKPEA